MNDLSFNMDGAECDENQDCTVSVTFNSSRIQDEVGQTTAAFSKAEGGKATYQEMIEDGRKKYELTCAYAGN